MTTAILNLPAASLGAGAITFADLPFPRANLLFHASAEQVVEEAVVGTATETRVVSFTDLDNASAYSVTTSHRIGKRATVNGLKVVDVSLQAGVATTARNYQFPANFIQGRNRIVLCGLSKADGLAATAQTIWGAGANANNSTTNASALFNIEHPTPTSLRFRAEAQKDDLTNTDVSATVSGLPAGFVVWMVTMDLVGKTMTLSVDKVGSQTVGMPDAVAPSPSTLVIRNGLFRHVAPPPTNTAQGNMFTGRFRRIAGFTDALGAQQMAMLISMFRAEAAVLNR